MDIEQLNENACNHEQMREALRVANRNFQLFKAVLEKIIADLEEIKSCPRPT